MTPQEIAQYIDHAAKQNDRYLLIVVAALVLLAGGFLIWFLLRWTKELVGQLASVVKENTQAFAEQREAFNDLVKESRESQRVRNH